MAYTYVWPGGLPGSPQKGFSETHNVNTVRTGMDAGPAKTRYRGRLPSNLTVSFIMTTAQVSTLEDFVHNTLKGSARFGFTHPRTGSVVEVRIVPGQAAMYNLQYLAPGYYKVDLQLEVLP